MRKPAVLGVDIGGSHITAALVDLETRAVIDHSFQRYAVNSQASAESIINNWCEVIHKAFQYAEIEEKLIGIAMPGPFDYQNGISLIKDQDKFKALYGMNIKKILAEKLAIQPTAIRFINDAAGFVQGEVFSGAAKGYKNVLGLTLGTGLGTAISINGITKDAELWDSSFLGGIAEDYLSTRWFINKYESLTGVALPGVKELAAIAETDAYAKQIFNEFGRTLGHFLSDIIKENGSEVVVLGGNIAEAFNLFSAHLMSNLQAYHLNTEVRVAKLNENATLIGAASQWDLVKSYS
jgi:glucokinase